MAEKTVKLEQTYTIGSAVFDSVTLAEPSFNDLLELGEPYEVQLIKGSLPVIIENTATVAAYVERSIRGINVAAMQAVSLSDARKVRSAVLDFFQRGEPAVEPSSPA